MLIYFNSVLLVSALRFKVAASACGFFISPATKYWKAYHIFHTVRSRCCFFVSSRFRPHDAIREFCAVAIRNYRKQGPCPPPCGVIAPVCDCVLSHPYFLFLFPSRCSHPTTLEITTALPYKTFSQTWHAMHYLWRAPLYCCSLVYEVVRLPVFRQQQSRLRVNLRRF